MYNCINLSSILVLGFFIFAVGCSSSGGTINQQKKENYNPQETWTLQDHLRRAAGVRLIGSKGSMRVIIRGESSVVNPVNQPLFTIDDQKAGRNFSRVNNMLSEGEITYIEVLPPSRATLYGMEGNYGVIKIFTQARKK